MAAGFRRVACALVALLGLWASVAAAQPAGEVEYVHGAGLAHSPGQPPRVLGRGLVLQQGDRLTVSSGGSAIVRLADGTRLTVRPDSELVLQQVQFKEQASDNALILQLVRGGLRALTGAVSKQSPDAAKIRTSVATIGIRGTEFDARLCGRECADAPGMRQSPARPGEVLASARLVRLQGEVQAADPSGRRRRLAVGSSLYPGDTLVSAAAGQAVVAFRDGSRVSVGPSTQWRLDDFVFDAANAREGRFMTTLLQGAVRLRQGLIASANPLHAAMTAPAATADGAAGPDPPDPGQVEVPANLFALEPLPEQWDGLFVFVRDGDVVLEGPGGLVNLGRDETGYADSRRTMRPEQVPGGCEMWLDRRRAHPSPLCGPCVIPDRS